MEKIYFMKCIFGNCNLVFYLNKNLIIIEKANFYCILFTLSISKVLVLFLDEMIVQKINVGKIIKSVLL